MLFRVLVAADRRPLANRLSALIGTLDVLVRTVALDRNISELAAGGYDAVLLGSSAAPGVEEVVRSLRALSSPPEVVVVTETHDIESGAAVLAAGGLGVLTADLGDEELQTAFKSLVERARSVRETMTELERVSLPADVLVAESPSMARALDMAKRAAVADSTVLLLGETGVGKERIAQLVHRESPRAGGPFIALNCAAIPQELIESELFGHTRGAFTGAREARRGYFELAHGGTLFLDEIAELPFAAQAKLLRVLQDRQLRPLGSDKVVPVDVRLIAATNRDLELEIRAGRFRSDLYYRLGVIELELPPLRDRFEDVQRLLDIEFDRFNAMLGRNLRGFTPAARRALEAYAWPGNIRELINVVERAMLLCLGDEIALEDLPRAIACVERADSAAPIEAPPVGGGAVLRLPDDWFGLPWREVREALLREGERAYLADALARTQGRIGLTAKHAGLAERSLFDKMKRHGLRKEDFREPSARGPSDGEPQD